MLLAHKIELRPTPQQAQYLNGACGSRRHCYNQLLEHFSKPENKWSKKAAQEYYMKVLRIEFPWYNEVSSRVTRNAIDDMDNAFKGFFRRIKAGGKPGFPRFKRKGIKDSFALREAPKFNVSGRELRIERLKTKIKLRQELRFNGVNKQVTVSHRVHKYFASVLVETDEYNTKDTDRQPSVGVDFGVKSLAVCSNGKEFPANQKLKVSMNRLAKLQRKTARRTKDSARRARAKLAVAKLHLRVFNQRQAQLHIVSDYLTSHFDLITIENLNVKGMVKNHKLARAVSDAGFGYLRQQIEYKAKLRNCAVVIADRFFPSTKLCMDCGQVHDMPLDKRTFECECGAPPIDRDVHAAQNLNRYGRDTFERDHKRTQESIKTPGLPGALAVTA